MRVSTGADVSPTSSIEQSAMISRRGRGRVRGYNNNFRRGRGSLEVVVDPMVADMVALIRGSDNISTARGIIISLRSVMRNLVARMGTTS